LVVELFIEPTIVFFSMLFSCFIALGINTKKTEWTIFAGSVSSYTYQGYTYYIIPLLFYNKNFFLKAAIVRILSTGRTTIVI
jgi:hypothetical protein